MILRGIKEITAFLFIACFVLSCAADEFSIGPYVGVTVDTQKLDEKITSDEAFTGTKHGKGKFSPAASIRFGNDFAAGNFIYGMAIEAGWGNSDTHFSFTNNGRTFNAQGHLLFVGHAKARLGYTFNDLLFYLGAGVCIGSFHHEEPTYGISSRDVGVGPSFFLGLEKALTKNFSALGEINYDIFPTISGGLGEDSYYAKPTLTSFKVGMIYKIEPPASLPLPSRPYTPPLQPVEIRFRSVG